MKTLATIALATLLAASPVHAANNDPVVLVHGFLGFGTDSFAATGFKYWGGFNDVAAHMRSGGRPVFTAAVGPVSSNWDRAVELYYQIKGGCADYGARHAAEHAAAGHIQKPAGKCWAADPANNPNNYPLALYPQWDAQHPVHFVSHSQGGQTIRTLVQLLENGPPSGAGSEGDGALYAGGKTGWVKSASTISSPHNGTTLRDVVVDFVPMVSELAGSIVGLAGLGGSSGNGFKFRLEQYGLAQAPGESIGDYMGRTRGAPFWQLSNRDAAQWDLGPDGAAQLNAWVKTSPNVYYFSIGSRATEQGSWCCNNTDRVVAPFQNSAYQYARNDMIFFLKNAAGEWVVPSILQRGMGSYRSAEWYANDGVVNTNSMRAPAGQAQHQFNGTPVKGSWNYLGYYDHHDHFDVIGWDVPPSVVYPIYDRLLGIFSEL
ncbi:esterase/lipase family protein [Pseudoduganella sp.]|uniref:esterase/lipase family protein n=1 Tax=Pseudoduganella sp. TaxID=1880898 RepID=UPI0035AEF429